MLAEWLFIDLDLSQVRGKKMAFSKKQALASCPLFGALEEDYLDKLLPTAHLRKFDDGGLLFLKGKKADGFFLVLAGEIEVFCISSQGRRQVLHVIGPGQLCGEVPLFAGGKYPASARARGGVKNPVYRWGGVYGRGL